MSGGRRGRRGMRPGLERVCWTIPDGARQPTYTRHGSACGGSCARGRAADPSQRGSRRRQRSVREPHPVGKGVSQRTRPSRSIWTPRAKRGSHRHLSVKSNELRSVSSEIFGEIPAESSERTDFEGRPRWSTKPPSLLAVADRSENRGQRDSLLHERILIERTSKRDPHRRWSSRGES